MKKILMTALIFLFTTQAQALTIYNRSIELDDGKGFLQVKNSNDYAVLVKVESENSSLRAYPYFVEIQAGESQVIKLVCKVKNCTTRLKLQETKKQGVGSVVGFVVKVFDKR